MSNERETIQQTLYLIKGMKSELPVEKRKVVDAVEKDFNKFLTKQEEKEIEIEILGFALGLITMQLSLKVLELQEGK